METYSEHQKKKTMIAAKRKLAMENSFFFNGNAVETCKSNPYVGSLISNNKQFKFKNSELCESASRAIRTVLRKMNNIFKWKCNNPANICRSSRRLENVFKTCLEDVFNTPSA